MKWLDKLERKFGRFAISNLITYVVALNAFVYLLVIFGGRFDFLYKLTLVPDLVMEGQVWRLITFIFIPPMLSAFWIVFALYFSYLAGKGLEQEWGSFKLNLYYLFGILSTIAVSFLTRGSADATYINLSLFLAFARIYPDYELLLFFVLPVKVKYLAYINWAYILYAVIFTPGIHAKLIALAPVINFLIFFGKDLMHYSIHRTKAYSKKTSYLREVSKKESLHKCSVCGITEKVDPDMEFRYCSKCNGNYEYCMEHIRNHEHIK